MKSRRFFSLNTVDTFLWRAVFSLQQQPDAPAAGRQQSTKPSSFRSMNKMCACVVVAPSQPPVVVVVGAAVAGQQAAATMDVRPSEGDGGVHVASTSSVATRSHADPAEARHHSSIFFFLLFLLLLLPLLAS